MATRKSGTRSLAPVSGSITNPNGITKITQSNSNTTIIASSFTGVTGYFGVIGNTGTSVVYVRNNDANVGNVIFGTLDPINIDQSLYSTTELRKAAQAYFSGGVGIEKDLAVGGFIYGRVAAANTATTASNIHVLVANDDQDYYPIFTDPVGLIVEGAQLYADTKDSSNNVTPTTGLRYNPYTGKLTVEHVRVTSADDATNLNSAALVVEGGAAVTKNLIVGQNILPDTVNTGSIGIQELEWAEGYVNNLYSKFIGSTSSNLVIAPNGGSGGITDIFSDIRVRGNNPIGTAPVVTNTLYVTMDGNDTNDGRAIDPSRACRTIGGAMKSPYYQPGTQILVSAGRYLEDNPLVMKPYTSVRGSDIRTTFVEPINKTQDLFHVNSGCYLNYMNFLNGRSGRLEGAYSQEFNRGAYATAFPPSTGDDRIDLFQSPYIQNCTNQSGPWLRDGTMFIPNSTIQVPRSTGIVSWDANTTTLIAYSDGPIEIGQAVSGGQQNPGFFNARTLLLANKPFIQSQTVAWVDDTFNSGGFTYNQIKCERDTGLIVNSIAQDMLQDSTSNSVFSGLQYWNQGNYTGNIPSEITATIQAITYVKGLAVGYATGAGGATPGSTVSAAFDRILDILNTGTTGITDSIVVNGLPSVDVNTVAAYDAILNNITSIQDDTINYIDSSLLVPLFTYDQAKCSRDTGFIVDALAQDLFQEGRTQSTFAGIQYWNQTGVLFPAELTTTTAAVNYIKSLAEKIVVNDTSGVRYSSEVQLVNMSAPGSAAEATAVGADFDFITGILTGGTAGVSDIIVPNNVESSSDTNVINAFNLLQSNKNYLKAEAIAFINATYPSFVYNQTICARDVDYIVDSVCYDLLHSGNKQAIQCGVYYYGYSNSTAIPGEVEQTTAAYNYIKELVYNVIQGIEIQNPYQLVVTQDTSLDTGTIQEVIESQKNIDYILRIISYGPSSADERRPISLQSSYNVNVKNAAKILAANRSFIQTEVIAYINSTFVYGYNKVKCRRDVGNILKSVAYDLLHGGNYQSTKSGVYYYSYSSNNTLTPTNEVAATVNAYNFIKSIISDIVSGKTIASPYQGVVPQVTAMNPGSSYEVQTLQNNLDIITGIVRNGPSYAPTLEPIGLTQNTASNVLNAYNIVIANTNFIKAEVIAFINTTMNTFNYNKQLCYRDAGILVENMAYDMAFGGNEKSIESGKAYYRGVTSIIAGQETQTIGAIDYIRDLCQKVVQNQVCPILPVPVNIPAGTQVINTALTGGAITTASIQKLFNITTNIIANGPDAAPAVFDNSPGPDAAFVSAEVLMQANRSFIQENTLNYINYFLCDPPKALPYNQIKCKRDAGVIIDSVLADLLFPTPNNSQSNFAGLQYYIQNRYTGSIKEQLGPTIDAVKYLRDLSVKVVQNITTATDALLGISRYTNGIQITATNYASQSEIVKIKEEFSNILSILGGKLDGWTDYIVPNTGTPSNLKSVQSTVKLLLDNVNYMANEIVAYVNANNAGFTYSTSTCARDVGYIIQSVAFDLLYGGNRQSVQSGLSYYTNYDNGTVIPSETTATIDAFTFIGNLASTIISGSGSTYQPLQNKVKINLTGTPGEPLDSSKFVEIISTITNIIQNGPSAAAALTPIAMTATVTTSTINAYNYVLANKEFIKAETIAYLDQTYNPNSFNYDQEKCYRDTGLIVDAVSQDILLGGNSKSIEAGLSYWSAGYNYIAGQESTTTAAINYIRDISLKIIANKPVDTITGTVATQIINPFYQYGGDYMPQEAVARNFHIINTIIENGPTYAPPVYTGGGLWSLVGPNGSSVNVAPRITSVEELSPGSYLIGLDQPTVGFGVNATLYFGDTSVFPLQNFQVEAKSLEYTGSTSTWNQRKVDPIGAMGGALIDGAVISKRSPIQSFVFDAYTQLNQGGIGVRITNNGYAQLVSVFTIFCSVGVQCDNGGIASITNSNCNFGDLSLVAKGYGPRDFSGTVFNPSYRAYPFSPNVPGGAYLDQFYPEGYWPNQGGRVEVFVPDSANRPHIGQVMEVIPPKGHINEQGFAGFLNVYPSTSTLTTGTITLTGISTNDVAIGNTVYIRDQFGRQYDNNGVWYAATGTVVTDLWYNSITLNQALTSGGGDPTNPTYFTLYFCGNSYYTVNTSEVAASAPYQANTNILDANADPYYEGPATSQIAAHVQSLQHLKSVVDDVIANIAITPTTGNTATQVISTTVLGGDKAQAFIDLRFDYMINIVNAADINAAKAVVPQSQITTSGTTPEGAGSAITLIQDNIDFLAEEVATYVDVYLLGGIGSYNKNKCIRDVKLILQQIIYDLQSGGNYNSVYSGLSYWSREGTYHIVELGEAVTRPDLFPDGSTVNFYQRSYISASGYLFEYVGAGTNYGALPQRGVADPVQTKETVQLNAGKVFFTSTDQNGDFRIGPGLVISQATGVLSGRTFVQSLYANMTPFILAIE